MMLIDQFTIKCQLISTSVTFDGGFSWNLRSL